MTTEKKNAPQASTGAALEAARREKLRKIQEMGIDPFGSRFDDHIPIGQIRDRVDEIVVEPADNSEPREGERVRPPEQHGPKVRAAGRIIRRRPSGKVVWLDIRDWSGTIQVMIGKKQVFRILLGFD